MGPFHPRRRAGSAKHDEFLDLVDDLRSGGHKALVFSQFVDYLALVRQDLDARGIPYQYLDGSTPAKARDKAVDAFQGGEGDLFLISLKAGGFGLNLTAADYVIHLDPWWNPAVEAQASDRTHRIGGEPRHRGARRAPSRRGWARCFLSAVSGVREVGCLSQMFREAHRWASAP